MKNLIIILLIFLLMPSANAAKIKIKSRPRIDVAQESIIKLNQKAMEQNNVFVVPRGRRIHSRLNDNIFRPVSEYHEAGKADMITTQLMQDWIYQDKTVAPEGSLVKGSVILDSSQNAIQVSFDTIIRPDNVNIRIISKPIIMRCGNYMSGTVSIPLGTEFTIQIINDVITNPY